MTVYGIQFWIECKGDLKTANELSDALDDLVYDGNLSLGYSNHSIMGAGLFMKNAVQNNFESIREILNEFADKIKYVSEWDYEDSSDMKWGVYTLGEARKSMKESKVMSFEEFKKLCNDNFGYAIMDFYEYRGSYIVVVSSNEKATELFTKALRKKGLECTFYELKDPNSEYYRCYEIMCV